MAHHGFIWSQDKGMQDLNDLLYGSGDWIISAAVDINEHGQIAA